MTAGGERLAVAAVISSAPLRSLAAIAEPAPPAPVSAAARGLRYRDFLTVALIIDGAPPFPDNWIYVHDPRARVGRIQNYRAWSPWMTPDPRRSCIGLEYFCFEGDRLWESDDDALVALAREEVQALGLVPEDRVVGGHVVRVPKAYPIYDAGYNAPDRRHPGLARRHRQPAADRPQRPAQVQQLRSLDADRDPSG